MSMNEKADLVLIENIVDPKRPFAKIKIYATGK